MSYPTTSIFPLLLLMMMGAAVSRYVDFDEDGNILRPIVTRSQQRKICAELCMGGLGGTACGEDCVDLVPQDLPLQFKQKNASESHGVNTRHGSCEVLCDNNLGFPLCGCEPDQKKKTDFMKVCSHYCLEYDYQIIGCQKCSVYNFSSTDTSGLSLQSLTTDGEETINWDLWCQNKCQKGDGGVACNCDLLPMSLVI